LRIFFDSLEEMMVEAAATVRPPERLTVSEAAEKYRYLNNPGSYVGPWLNSKTPYLVEPTDVLSSVSYTAMIFCGPAQCGKTDMFLNWQTYTVCSDPADMMLIQTSQTTARDFSKRRIDRLHRHTRAVGERLIQRRNSDNTFDKQYASGMMLSLSWPAINELSGKPVPRLWLTDYDRMPEDIDGEGAPFDLARKRATTFKSNGMCAAESSPGFVVENPRWVRRTAHEAPPTKGILALFNRGDRRRWYWPCVDCGIAFEPDFSLLTWPQSADKMEAAEAAVMHCPHCGGVYSHDKVQGSDRPDKNGMNQRGFWLRDGQKWNAELRRIEGVPPRSDIASFWLKGVAATFADWKTLVLNYLKALEEYELTGSEQSLKTTVNVDQGDAYVPKSLESTRLPEELKNRAKAIGQQEVPLGARFLIATVDVQKNRFVVQVHGFGEGSDCYIVDRFDIRKSTRQDADGDATWVNPGSYPEDWKLLISQVMNKTYPLADGSGRHMAVKLTLCDSGGREGVTTNAYDFYRFLKNGPEPGEPDEGWVPNLQRRFQLVKGAANKTAPRTQIGYPDSERKDRHAGARGEIPVLFINPNMVKDHVDKMLGRTEPRGGMVHFPNWLPDTFYTELTVEVKTNKGWENPKNFRNESWDLLSYALAGAWSRHINMEHIDWTQPPTWAEEWDVNDLVFMPVAEEKPFAAKPKTKHSLSKLADRLA
jgi:phage terminase large subunit GpA-like protein